jgi:2-polyprenyl-3-methyl-5-hydroxy-6-metoxy-1,4-benzoquinol methylase
MQDTDERAIARRIGAHYRRRGHRHYASSKLRFDPVFAAACELLLQGSGEALLDVGCGLGLLGQYLRERGWSGAYLGLDFDAGKIDAARAAAQSAGIDLAFEPGDARRGMPPFSGHVALLDVLHYLGRDEQRALLRELAMRVAPGGMLILRNVLRAPGWRFRLTVLEERFLYASRWMRSPARHFPEREEVEAPLREAGLVVEVNPLWGDTPFNSFLIVARRPLRGEVEAEAEAEAED